MKSQIHCYLFSKDQLIKMNINSYLVLYFSYEGELMLDPVSDEPEKQVFIKLPSDYVPSSMWLTTCW